MNEPLRQLLSDTLDDLRAAGSGLLAQVRDQDAQAASDLLRRAAEIHAQIVADPTSADRLRVELASVRNALNLIAVRYGLDGLAEYRRFSERLRDRARAAWQIGTDVLIRAIDVAL